MNKTTTRIAIAAVPVMIAGSSSAQTDLYSTVTNLWWEGPKTNILAIAEERLARRFPDERTAGRSVMSFPFGSRAPAAPAEGRIVLQFCDDFRRNPRKRPQNRPLRSGL